MRRANIAEAILHGFEHRVADVGAADPSVRNGTPGNDFPVMGVEDECTPDDVAVPSQVNSMPSEHQRRSDRITTTLPSW